MIILYVSLYAHKWKTYEQEFSRVAQKCSLSQFSLFISEIMPQLHHQVASMLSLFGSIYLCSRILPRLKIKSSTNHLWWSPWQIYPVSVLWKCPYSWRLKNWKAYIKEEMSGVPWERISQSTLTAGSHCNKYDTLADVSHIWMHSTSHMGS